jgi:hypothetical protein
MLRKWLKAGYIEDRTFVPTSVQKNQGQSSSLGGKLHKKDGTVGLAVPHNTSTFDVEISKRCNICNGKEIDRSTVTGTLTAVGESLRVGSFANIDKVVLNAPQAANHISITFIQSSGKCGSKISALMLTCRA